jgi:hypothetical protein
MDALLETLDSKLREWTPSTAVQVRLALAELIESADQNVLDLARSRAVEQEVMDLIDAPPPR